MQDYILSNTSDLNPGQQFSLLVRLEGLWASWHNATRNSFQIAQPTTKRDQETRSPVCLEEQRTMVPDVKGGAAQ